MAVWMEGFSCIWQREREKDRERVGEREGGRRKGSRRKRESKLGMMISETNAAMQTKTAITVEDGAVEK